MCYLKPLWTCVLFGKLQVNWTSPQMILAGLGRGGGASSSVVPYSSCRPSSCLASLSHWMNRTWMVEGRASRPCCLLPSPWSTRAQNPKGPFMVSIWTVDSRFVSISEVRLNKWGRGNMASYHFFNAEKLFELLSCSLLHLFSVFLMQ